MTENTFLLNRIGDLKIVHENTYIKGHFPSFYDIICVKIQLDIFKRKPPPKTFEMYSRLAPKDAIYYQALYFLKNNQTSKKSNMLIYFAWFFPYISLQ